MNRAIEAYLIISKPIPTNISLKFTYVQAVCPLNLKVFQHNSSVELQLEQIQYGRNYLRLEKKR